MSTIDYDKYNKLVMKVVMLYVGRDDFQDMVQEGWVGLLEASKTYDKDRGVKFSTYAYHIIRSYVRNFVAKGDNVYGSINLFNKKCRIRKTERDGNVTAEHNKYNWRDMLSIEFCGRSQMIDIQHVDIEDKQYIDEDIINNAYSILEEAKRHMTPLQIKICDMLYNKKYRMTIKEIANLLDTTTTSIFIQCDYIKDLLRSQAKV